MAFDFLGTFNRKWYKKLFDEFLASVVKPKTKDRAKHQRAEVKRFQTFQENIAKAKEPKQGTNGDIAWKEKYEFPGHLIRVRGALDDGDSSVHVQDVMKHSSEPLKFKHEKLEYSGKIAADLAEQAESNAKKLEEWPDLYSKIKEQLDQMFASGQHNHHLFEDGQFPLTLYSEDPRYKGQQPVQPLPLTAVSGSLVTEVSLDQDTGQPGINPATGRPSSIYTPVVEAPPQQVPGTGLGEGAVGLGPLSTVSEPIPPPTSQIIPIVPPGGEVIEPEGIGGIPPEPIPVVVPVTVVVLPDGTKVLPEGTIIYPGVVILPELPEGTITLPPGTIMQPDCSLLLPDGTVMQAQKNSCEVVKSGVQVRDKEGNLLDPCTGGLILPNGNVKLPNGDVIVDGCIFRFDGKVKWPDGSLVYLDCSVHRPNGDIWLPNGDIKFPNGDVMHPDGSITDSEGAVLKPACAQRIEDPCGSCTQIAKGPRCRRLPKCFPQNCNL